MPAPYSTNISRTGKLQKALSNLILRVRVQFGQLFELPFNLSHNSTKREYETADSKEKQIKQLRQRTPFRTTFMLALALAMTLSAMVFTFWRYEYQARPLDMYLLPLWIFIGMMFAHLTELQHELLHSHAFRSKGVNRCLGFICGVFTVSSFTEYKYIHLLHHIQLGTPENTEFFNYKDRGYDGIFKLGYASLSLNRYVSVLKAMRNAIFGIGFDGISNARAKKHTRQEYIAYFCLLLIISIASVYNESIAFIICWLIPALFVAEPIHFLIELPEHYGLNAHSDKNVKQNTRSIVATRFSSWLTNGNNYHVAHHTMAAIPMRRCDKYNELIKHEHKHVEESYPTFFNKVINGSIKRSEDSYT